MARKKKDVAEATENAPENKVRYHATLNFGSDRIALIIKDSTATIIMERAGGKTLTGKAELKEE